MENKPKKYFYAPPTIEEEGIVEEKKEEDVKIISNKKRKPIKKGKKSKSNKPKKVKKEKHIKPKKIDKSNNMNLSKKKKNRIKTNPFVISINLLSIILRIVVGLFTSSSLLTISGIFDLKTNCSMLIETIFVDRYSKKEIPYGYGYFRIKSIGEMISSIVLLICCGIFINNIIVYFVSKPPVYSDIQIFALVIGIFINIITLLYTSKTFLSEIKISLIFMVVAIPTIGLNVINTEFGVLDPLFSLFITFAIMVSLIKTGFEHMEILMQKPIKESALIKEEIENIDGVVGIMDLKTWKLDTDKNIVNAKVLVTDYKVMHSFSINTTKDRIIEKYNVYDLSIVPILE